MDDRILARPEAADRLAGGQQPPFALHAEVGFANPGQVVDLHLRVQPDDLTPSFLEIWLPHAGAVPPASDTVKLSVVAPGGAGATSLLGETDVLPVVVMNDGEVVCAAQSFFKPTPTERRHFRVTLQPTARLHPTATPADAKRIAPPGVWTVKLHNVSLSSNQRVQAWIRRDDAPYGYPILGRQSYFDDPGYVRFDKQGREIEEDSHLEQVNSPTPVKRAGSVSGIATGAEAIVAGGYRRKEFGLAPYSAGQPISPTRNLPLDPNQRKPDAVLVSDELEGSCRRPRGGQSQRLDGRAQRHQRCRAAARTLGRERAGDSQSERPQRRQSEGDARRSRQPPPERRGWGRMLRGWSFPRPRYWP